MLKENRVSISFEPNKGKISPGYSVTNFLISRQTRQDQFNSAASDIIYVWHFDSEITNELCQVSKRANQLTKDYTTLI